MSNKGATSPVSPGPPTTLQLSGRKSSRDRIWNILEGARERAESLDPSTSPANVSPRLQPLLGSSPRFRRASDPPGASASPPLEEEEADLNSGHGGVIAQQQQQQQPRQRSLNYQSTAETSPTATRRRPTQQSSRRSSGQQQVGGQTPTRGPGEGDGELRNRLRGQQQPQQDVSWWKRTLRYFKSIELENKGSVARDHLALERTFLAWLRTSLAFASIGIAITQLFRLNTSVAPDSKQAENLRHLGKPLGTTFLAVSVLILLLGYNRYLQGQHWVIRGKFPASRGSIMLVSLIAFSVTLASLIVILTVQSNPL